MCDDEELGSSAGAAVDLHQQSQLPLRRKRGLRLIQEIQSAGAEAVLRQRQKTLPMRLLMKMLRSSARPPAVLIFLGRHVIKALRTKEIAPSCAPDASPQPDGAAELGVRVISGKAVVSGSAFRIKTAGNGHRLQQSGFPAAVLTDEESHIMGEADLVDAAESGNGTQIAVLLYSGPVDHYAADQLPV